MRERAARAILVALAFSCARTPEPEVRAKVSGGDPGAEPIVRKVVPARDVAELCGNAYDDNGNGLINEGCGDPQGELHVAIAWLGASEVDLFVFDPSGAVAPLGGATAQGLVRTRDCPGEGSACNGLNAESVVHEGDRLAPGRYRIVVRAAQIAGENVDVELGVRLPAGGESYSIEFRRPGTEFAFEVIVPKSLEKLEEPRKPGVPPR